MYNKNDETRLALSQVYNTMKNRVAARMLRDSEYGMPATTKNIEHYTQSKKIYYTNLRRLIKAKLIRKDEMSMTYRTTALGYILLWADNDMVSLIENNLSGLSPNDAEIELCRMKDKDEAYHRHKETLEKICEKLKRINVAQ